MERRDRALYSTLTGGSTSIAELRLRLAAIIRHYAKRNGLPIREAYRRAESRFRRRNFFPWPNIEAFEDYCGGRRHAEKIAEVESQLRGDGFERFFSEAPLTIKRDPFADGYKLRQDEGERFLRDALKAYTEEIGARCDEPVITRYAHALWTEWIPPCTTPI